jgi:hypothetical protein
LRVLFNPKLFGGEATKKHTTAFPKVKKRRNPGCGVFFQVYYDFI